MNIIQVTNLKKKYRNGDGVEDITFSVHSGEIVALLGPNGAGKTTTIRCLAGLYTPDDGTIKIAGHSPGTVEAQQSASLIPDHPYLYPTLTVAEHLQFRARAFKVEKKDLQKKVYEALKEVNIESLADRLSGQLSRGQKQRVILAGAIIQNASIYILDEPTIGLDISSKQWLANWLVRKSKHHSAILISTHSLEFVLETANRVLLIREGRIVKEMAVPKNNEEYPAWKQEVIRSLGDWSND
ncbi:ABC transporter ATP-binding protein [Aeribacillus composti]|jgi:ABC-type multidrug transport system, ATPase component|uniref:ABC transporter ATP-binding protein n=1 Tax=Aeribacillus composti TaxID=1868734 RepID=UPI000E365DD1|nr:ABC transporter ATP-binding protein [Aeribacillus composti]REJ26033.1 MAG: multidrug ABC transporter ATP-binding protein [Bacillaceae bacterium]